MALKRINKELTDLGRYVYLSSSSLSSLAGCRCCGFAMSSVVGWGAVVRFRFVVSGAVVLNLRDSIAIDHNISSFRRW